MIIKKISIVAISAILSAMIGTSANSQEQSNPPQLPVLNWTPRSDWINIKDPATFPPKPKATPANKPSVSDDAPAKEASAQQQEVLLFAKGDGIADDTDAIQFVLDRLQTGNTLYFPAGKYRITRTLQVNPVQGRGSCGMNIIGHGRDTVLFWDGEKGGTMFFQHTGWAISRYVGLTWDGRGKAATGFLHRAMKMFETEVRHDCEAFLNFTADGIHLGGGALATAEISYNNCLFENCGTGLFINGGDKREDNGKYNFNYLDNTVRACEFRNCRQAIYAGPGTNAYVRESHFEHIAGTVMIFLGEAGSSVRHCSARDIGIFIEDGSSVGPLTVQDCFVEKWGAEWDPKKQDSVIKIMNNSAPCLLFDNKFRLARKVSGGNKMMPVLNFNPSSVKYFLANNFIYMPEGGKEQLALIPPLNKEWPQLGRIVPIEDVPGIVKSGGQSFFRTDIRVPSKVFDAKVDFKAKGDGKSDDTEAVQNTIDAAREHGNDAIAYLPKGRYNVKSTLKMAGSNYRLGGCGFGTGVIWKGQEGGVTLEITDPDNLILENIVIGRHDYPQGNNSVDILQTSTQDTRPNRITYEHVAVFGMYQKKPSVKGLQLVNLRKNDVVCIDQVNGNIRITDSSSATVYLGLSYEGTVTVEGKSPDRGGFVGGNVRLGTDSDPGIWIRDNQSFSISDLYCESSRQYMRLEGDDALPAGVVVASGPKFEINPKVAETTPSVLVLNYKGELLIGPYNYYVMNKQHWFKQEGDSPFTMLMWAGNFYNSAPRIDFAGAKYLAAGLRRMGEKTPPEEETLFKDAGDELVLNSKMVTAITKLRQIGNVSYRVLYGGER